MISCHEKKTEDAPWILDRFDDIKILRYEVSALPSCLFGRKS